MPGHSEVAQQLDRPGVNADISLIYLFHSIYTPFHVKKTKVQSLKVNT